MAESDEQRFERIYQQHFKCVAAYLLARTDRDSAAEALARSFEIAWRRIADVPAEPLPWLLGVARRVLAQQRRAQGRRDALVDRIAQSAAETAEDHTEAIATREVVLEAIRALTPLQQEVLLLIAWDGLSEREAAAVLGCSRGAVALRLHRARRQLRGALERAGPSPSRSDDPSIEPLPCGAISPTTQEAT